MRKKIIFIFLLIGIISFSVAKKSNSGFYVLNNSELSRLFGSDEGCRGIGMLYLSEAMIKNKKSNATIKMKKSVLEIKSAITRYFNKIGWNTSGDISKNINIYFQSKCSKLKRNDVKEIVPELENVLNENNLIYIEYNSENSNQTKKSKMEQIFNVIFGKNYNENSTRKIKIISQNDVVAIATIGDNKYNLYPTKDVEIISAHHPNLTYEVNLNPGVSKKSKGKIVGTYVATDGTLTYSGELIMK